MVHTAAKMANGSFIGRRAGERGVASIETAVSLLVFALLIAAVMRLGILGVETIRCLGAARLQADAHRGGGGLDVGTLATAFGTKGLTLGASSGEQGGTDGSGQDTNDMLHGGDVTDTTSTFGAIGSFIANGLARVAGLRLERVSSTPSGLVGAFGMSSITTGASTTTVEGCWGLGGESEMKNNAKDDWSDVN